MITVMVFTDLESLDMLQRGEDRYTEFRPPRER